MADDRTPLDPDELDELLSADLDGELDAVARERGVSTAELSALLHATPGAEARRVALAAARDLLAQAPEIDELVAARLRAKAVRAAEADVADRRTTRARRRYRVVAAVAGVAAVGVGVVALAAGLNGAHGGSKSAESSPAAVGERAPAGAPPSSTEHAPALASGAGGTPQPTALGTFSDKQALARAAVGRATAVNAPATGQYLAPAAGDGFKYAGQPKPSGSKSSGAASSSPDGRAAPTTTVAAPSTRKGLSANGTTSTAGRSESNLGGATPADQGAALAACTARPSGLDGDTLVLRATAVLSGKPVLVLVFASTGEHVVVVEDTHCTLLDVQMLG